MAHGAAQRLAKELSNPIYWIEYPQLSREIRLNDKKRLARLHFAGQNDLVFQYIFDNPYRLITLKELEENATREPLHKTLHEFVRAFGFTHELRQLFFDVSKQAVFFRKEIYFTEIPTTLSRLLYNPSLMFYEDC